MPNTNSNFTNGTHIAGTDQVLDAPALLHDPTTGCITKIESFLDTIDNSANKTVTGSSATLVQNQDVNIWVTAATGGTTLTLPSASGQTKDICIHKSDSAVDNVIIQGAGSDILENIFNYDITNTPTVSNLKLKLQYDSITLHPDGTTWRVVSFNSPMMNKITFRAYKTGTQLIAGGGAITKITYNTENWNPSGAFNLTTSEFTAPVDGYYEFNSLTYTFQTGVSYILPVVAVNGTDRSFGTELQSSGGDNRLPVIALIKLTAGDKVTIGHIVTSGAASAQAQAGATSTFFSGRIISRL
jgi:hypothetical protein